MRQSGDIAALAIAGPCQEPPHAPRVAIIVQESVGMLETAAAWTIFNAHEDPLDETHRRPVGFLSAHPGTTVDLLGVGCLVPQLGLQHAAGSDIVFLAPPSTSPEIERQDLAPNGSAHLSGDEIELATALHQAVRRGAKIVAVGTSVFTLARTGLLDGRTVTTHASLVRQFRRRFPHIEVRPEALFIDDGPVLTAAGGAATLDVCLHVVSNANGPSEATRLEQTLLTGPRRSGHHGQRVDHHLAQGPGHDQRMTELLSWMSANLHLELSIDVLSSRSYMSRRSLTRRFRAATGTTPYAWIIHERVRLARELLVDRTDLSIEDIASRVGFGNAGALRQHFHRSVGRTPTQYRDAVLR